MKNATLSFIAAAGIALSGATLPGCAATATHESTGDYVDDSVITTKVKSEILGDPALKSFQIGVTTYKGVVQLSGFVDSGDVRRRAGAVASGVQGVSRVKNDLIVK